MESLLICSNAGGAVYPYSVTGSVSYTGSLTVIDDLGTWYNKKPIFFPESVPMMLTGLVIGFAIGYLVRKRQVGRTR